MKNTFGNQLTVTLFGESRGPAVGCVLDGIAPGIRVDLQRIANEMDLRRAEGDLSTERREADEVRFLSGVRGGYTEGTPICILIENTDVKGEGEIRFRPGHADYTQFVKYHGYADLAGGGHSSGRLTAPIVAAGALIRSALADKGILIGTHISRLHGVCDRDFSDFTSDIHKLYESRFPVLSGEAGDRMKAEIRKAKETGDSVGGILETVAIGLPAGIGEPFFDSAESMLSHALFSIPGIKGVEFGDGFAFADALGSEMNDALVSENGILRTKTNHNGGISGGITTGAPIRFSAAVRPTASIGKEQTCFDPLLNKTETLTASGRNDPAILHRVRAVVDAVTALTLADMLTVRFGVDYFSEKTV